MRHANWPSGRHMILVLLACVLPHLALADKADEIASVVDDAEAEARAEDSRAPENACIQSPIHSSSLQDLLKIRKMKPVKNSDRGTNSLSVLSEKEAKAAFDHLASQAHIPFKYTENGCSDRAIEMMRILNDSLGITGGIYFAEGRLRLETPGLHKNFDFWNQHMAVAVLVREKGRERLMIIDPSMASKPLTREEWKKAMTKGPGLEVTEEGLSPQGMDYVRFMSNEASHNLRIYSKAQKKREEILSRPD